MSYIWLIDFTFGDLKLSHNRQNGEHNIVSSAKIRDWSLITGRGGGGLQNGREGM